MTLPRKAAARVVVHTSDIEPALSQGYPDEIQLWFQPSRKMAFLLCPGAWTEWTKGTAIKDVCPKISDGQLHD